MTVSEEEILLSSGKEEGLVVGPTGSFFLNEIVGLETNPIEKF